MKHALLHAMIREPFAGHRYRPPTLSRLRLCGRREPAVTFGTEAFVVGGKVVQIRQDHQVNIISYILGL